MDSDLQFRQQITAELADSAPPPLGSIVADATARGARLRRRHRFARATAGVAVLGAGAVLVWLVGVGPGAHALGRQPAGADPVKSAAPTPTSSPSVAPGRTYTTGRAVVALLLDLVPPGGQTSELRATPLNPQDAAALGAGTASGGFLYDDGTGAATISAGVTDQQNDSLAADFRCPPDATGFTCTRSSVRDLQIRVSTMGPYTTGCSDAKCGIKDVRVEVKRPDGVYVTVDSYNGPFGGGRAATRADTVLSVPKMITIASDPRWGLTMDRAFVDAAEKNIHVDG
jgi:hypothetical protein